MPPKKRALPPWLMGVVETSKEKRESQSADSPTGGDREGPAELPGACRGDKRMKTSQDTNGHADKQPCVTADKIVEMSYPVYRFKGSIIYSYNKGECNLLCEELLSEMDTAEKPVIGFDMEWPVTYERGKQGKTALIQIASSTEKCYLFQVSCMSKFPSILEKIIKSQTIKKVGLNITNDLWKLEADYDVSVRDVIQKSAVELKTLANQKLKSSENWSLEGLSRNVLRQRINKDPHVRTCDWSHFPLTEEQQKYAASDAVVSLMLYFKLNKMGKTDTQ